MCCTRECLTRRLQNAISSTMVILVFTTKLWSRLLATEKAGHRIAIRRSESGSLLRLHQLSRIFVMVVKTVVDRCTNTARQTQLVDKLMNVALRTLVSIYVDESSVERHVGAMSAQTNVACGRSLGGSNTDAFNFGETDWSCILCRW